MQELQYVGEQLLPGRLGHFFVLLGFISAILAALSYYQTTNKRTVDGYDKSWLKLSRGAFLVHTISVFAAIGLIFFVMINQMYEYRYAWEHVSNELPMRYIFSAFWEGQEGSFLLWMFWHVILGGAIILKKGKWEAPVMATLALVEVIIASMILGVYFTDAVKIGSSPFLLLRDTMDAPVFNNPEYLSLIDGNGLNPLLQNYWMTIHPPTLFLGFASVTIPFCFAIAGLWIKEHSAWLKAVLPWALFSAGILGTGIVMGGAWAYEALNFGGYWAWDPVENMSLVPWLILLAGIHSNLISRSTGHAVKSSYLFYILSFILIVYSTFLTRSGVLGDESVHAFTEMGLEWQLIIFMVLFTTLGAWLFLSRRKEIPSPKKEEKLESREFWMFIGTLVLLFSTILITFTTSIPVYNKLFDVVGLIFGQDMSHLHRSMPVEPEPHFNRYQLWIAVFIALLSSIAQVLRYKGAGWPRYKNKFFTHLAVSVLAAGVLFFLIRLWIETFTWQNAFLLAFACFAAVSNIDYVIRFIRGNWKVVGSSLSHFGFAIMLIGIIASGANKNTISRNEFAQGSLLDSVDPRKNIVLIKGKPMFMEGYWVTYRKDTIIGQTREFIVDYRKINLEGDTVERFSLIPNVLYNKQFAKVNASNPDTKHYLDRDIFSYIHALPAAQMDAEEGKKLEAKLVFNRFDVHTGDTLITEKNEIVIEQLVLGLDHPEYEHQSGDLAFSMQVKARKIGSTQWYNAKPGLIARQALLYRYPDQINDLNMRLELPDEAINLAFTPESELEYVDFALQQGEKKIINGVEFELVGIDQNASHITYTAEEGDIAINAIISARKPGDSPSYELRPLFLIRGNAPYNYKDFAPSIQTHLRFTRIDPASEIFYFSAAFEDEFEKAIGIRIAENAPRDDLIVMEVIEFPGINLFWLGTIMMMLGLFLSMYVRSRNKQAGS
jgi:cytochrome c-type biogenesis protein CcmF